MRAEAVLEIGAIVVDDFVAQCRHPVVFVERKLHIVDAIGAVIVARGDVVDPVLDIFDRAACNACSEPASTGTLCRNTLLPKLPPASTGTRLSLMTRDLERSRDNKADIIVHRRVDVDREFLGCLIEARHRATGLDRLAAGAGPAKMALDHMGGTSEFLLDRAERIVADARRHCPGRARGAARRRRVS